MEYGRGDNLYGFGRQNGPNRGKKQYTPRNINSEEDFQEIMQREFDREKELLGITGEKGISDQYLMLDSFKKNPNSRVDQGEFIFDLAIQGSTSDSVIGVRDKLDNVIEIQIGAFYLPPMPPISYGPADDTFTLILPTTDVSQYYPGQHISVYIKETGLQSYSDSNGKRHNFDLIANDNTYSEISYTNTNSGVDGSLLAEPYVGWDTYKFTDPIMDLSKITLQFTTPDNPLNFYNDTFYVSTLPITGGITSFQIVNSDLFNALKSKKYIGNNIVKKIVISGFNCASTSAYNIINNPYGVLADLSGGTPTVQISPSLVFNVAVPSFNVKVQILQNRVRIPLKVRRLISRKTNSIIPI